MRFLIDMPISPELCRELKKMGHDAIHVSSLNLHKAKDEEIVQRAIQEERIIITADLGFGRILALTKSGAPGLILFRGGNYKDIEIVNLTKKVLNLYKYQELETSITVVDKRKIRRTRLPLNISS